MDGIAPASFTHPHQADSVPWQRQVRQVPGTPNPLAYLGRTLNPQSDKGLWNRLSRYAKRRRLGGCPPFSLPRLIHPQPDNSAWTYDLPSTILKEDCTGLPALSRCCFFRCARLSVKRQWADSEGRRAG